MQPRIFKVSKVSMQHKDWKSQSDPPAVSHYSNENSAGRPSTYEQNKCFDSNCAILHNKSDWTTSVGHRLWADLTDFQYFKWKR